MPDNYSFKEAFTDTEKVRRALDVGTDGSGNTILRPVVAAAEDQTGTPITQVATNDGRALIALELDDGQGTTGRITRTETAQDVAGHALDQNGALQAIEVVDDGSGNYLLNTNIANQISARIDAQTADLATQTTLSSVLSELQSKLDVQVADGDDVALGAKGDSAVTDSQAPATVIQALKGLLFKQSNGVSSKGVDSQGDTPSAAPVAIAGQYEINATQVSDGEVRRLAVNEAGQPILATLSAVEDSLEAVDSVGTVIYLGSEYVVNETRTSGTAAGSGTLLASSAGDNHIVLDATISFDGDGGIDAQLTDGTNPIWGYTGSEGVSAKGGRKIAEAGEGNALGYSIALGTATSISKYYIEISYITV